MKITKAFGQNFRKVRETGIKVWRSITENRLTWKLQEASGCLEIIRIVVEREYKYLLIIVFFWLVGSFSVNAQTDLEGRYVCAGKEGKAAYSFALKFEGKDAVYYSYEYNRYGTLEGKWSVENEFIKVVLTSGNTSLSFTFRQKGSDLEYVDSSPPVELIQPPELRSTPPKGSIFKKEVSKPSGPDLTAQEFSKRALKLIKSVRRLKDFSPANIERQTKIKVSFNEENRREYGFGGNVVGAPDWTYGLIAYPYPSKDNQQTDTLRFSFDYQLHEPIDPDLSAACVDFEAFGKELTKAGFSTPAPIRGELDMILYWHSERNKISLNISARGKNKNGKSPCVKMLTVSALNQ